MLVPKPQRCLPRCFAEDGDEMPTVRLKRLAGDFFDRKAGVGEEFFSAFKSHAGHLFFGRSPQRFFETAKECAARNRYFREQLFDASGCAGMIADEPRGLCDVRITDGGDVGRLSNDQATWLDEQRAAWRLPSFHQAIQQRGGFVTNAFGIYVDARKLRR